MTAKMRLVWDEANLPVPDLSRAQEDAGIAAIIGHDRTKEQGFERKVSLTGIEAVVSAVSTVSVFGNGNVTTPVADGVMIDRTGCQRVSSAGTPFIIPKYSAIPEHFWIPER